MNSTTKEKAVNMEDMQRHTRKLFNKGLGNYGTCSTAAATAAKEVTLGNTFILTAGATILVKFTNGISVANATLAVTHTPIGASQATTETAKAIYLNGSALAAGVIPSGAEVILRYDGTNFNIIGGAGGGGSYTLPIASANDLGGVKVGTNLSIDANGVLSATDTTYSTMGASGSSHAGGLVPDTPSTEGTTKYLCEDGTWKKPYSSETAASGGTKESLVTTGEKYDWNQMLTDIGYDQDDKLIYKSKSFGSQAVVNALRLVKDGHGLVTDSYTNINDRGTSEDHYDLDYLTTPGQYVMSDGSLCDYFDNKPSSQAKEFEVTVSKPIPSYIIHVFNYLDSSTQYRRYYYEDTGEWSDWYRFSCHLDYNFQGLSNYTSINSWGTSSSHYNLNNLTDCGTFSCGTNSYAAYFDNRPVALDYAFRIIVFQTRNSSSYKAQRFQYSTPINNSNKSNVWERYTTNGGDSWSDWVLVQQDMNGFLNPAVLAFKYTGSNTDSGAVTIDASDGSMYYTKLSGNVSSITLNNMEVGQILFAVFVSSSTSATRTIAISSSSFKTKDGNNLSITVPKSGEGYSLVAFQKLNTNIYVYKLV